MEAVAVMEKLNSIQSELDFIKEHMVDVDTILTEEDRADLAQARNEFKEGKTISLEKLKKELNR
jgi:hypothetical protein